MASPETEKQNDDTAFALDIYQLQAVGIAGIHCSVDASRIADSGTSRTCSRGSTACSRDGKRSSRALQTGPCMVTFRTRRPSSGTRDYTASLL